MKKLLLLISILLVACGKTTSESSSFVSEKKSEETTNEEKKNEESTSSSYYQSKALVNVVFEWDYDTHCYLVYVDKDNYYYMPPKNLYEIKVDEYKRVVEERNGTKYYGDIIYNEYFKTTNELYSYYK